jgi:hypothetical protein
MSAGAGSIPLLQADLPVAGPIPPLDFSRSPQEPDFANIVNVQRLDRRMAGRDFGGEPLARLRCSSGGASFRPSKPTMEAPETPPDLPLDDHTRAGFSLANQPA